MRELAGLTGEENVYDLYCGAGSITLYLAGAAKHVAGVELVPESVADAKVNAEFNGITNVSFTAGDMKKIFDPAFVAQARQTRCGGHRSTTRRHGRTRGAPPAWNWTRR